MPRCLHRYLVLSGAPAVTGPDTAVGLTAALADLPDPRARREVRHALTSW
jgi:hypothetical protein